MFEYVIIGTCLQLNAYNVALNTYAGLPWCDPIWTWICTTSLLADPYEVPEAVAGEHGVCVLDIPAYDSWFDPYWCQETVVEGQPAMTPCTEQFINWSEIPGGIQQYLYDTYICTPWMHELEFC
jgi:hypothetical protein